MPDAPFSRSLRIKLPPTTFGRALETAFSPITLNRALQTRLAPIVFGLIAIGLCWFYLYYPWLSNNYVIPYDSIDYYYPTFFFTSQSLRHGQLPWWDPYLFSGFPQIADPQSLIFSPTVILPMAAVANPSPHWLDVIVLLHILFGGVGMFGLLRQMRLSTPAAIFGAVITIGGGCLPARLEHTTLLISTCILPWVGWALFALCSRPTLHRGLAFGVAVGWLGLHLVQTTFIALMLIAIALGADVLSKRDSIGRIRRLAPPLLIAGVVTILICGLQVAALLTFLPETIREHLALSESAVNSAPFKELTTFVRPNAMHTFSGDFHGPIDITESVIYCGYLAIPSFCLGLIMLARPRFMPGAGEGRAPLGPGVYRLSAGLLGFSVLYALGTKTPFYALLYYAVPGVSLFRRPVDGMFLATLCLAPVAALGFEGALAWVRRRGLITTAAAFGAEGELSRLHGRPSASLMMAAAALPILLLCRDLGSNTLKPNLTNSTRSSYAASLPDHYELMNLLRLGGQNPGQPDWRVEINRPADPWADLAAVAKIYSTQGYNPLREARYEEVFGVTPDGYSPIEFSKWTPGYQASTFGILGVKYVVSLAGSATDDLARKANLKLAFQADGMNAWETANHLPRLFSPSEAVAATADGAPQATGAVKDLAKTVVIEATANAPPSCGGASLRSIRLLDYRNNDVSVRTEGGPSSGWLVMTDPDTLGWHAYVDGRETPLLRADAYMRAVCVPAGSHLVAFRFEPFRQIAETILHHHAH